MNATFSSRRDRGSSILFILVMTTIAVGIVLVTLMASSTLRQQSMANLERTSSRNEARSAINLIASYLDQRVNSGNALKPPAAEWSTDGDGRSYFVIVGRAGTGGMPTCTLDTAKAYSTPGSATNLVSKRADWLAAARTYLSKLPADVTFVARIEMEGDPKTRDWYYHAYSAAATDDRKARSGPTPVVLVSQAALIPYHRSPFIQGGMTGLQQVTLQNAGNLVGTLDGSSTNPFIATNGNVVLK